MNLEILNKETRKAIGSLLRVAPARCETPTCTILASTWLRIKIFFRRPHSDRNSSTYSYSTEETFVTSEIVRATEGYAVGRPRDVLYVGGPGEDPAPRELIRRHAQELDDARAIVRGHAEEARRRRQAARAALEPRRGAGGACARAPALQQQQHRPVLADADEEWDEQDEPRSEETPPPEQEQEAESDPEESPNKKARKES